MAKTTVASGYIASGAVGITELGFSDGSAGQFLKTDGSGTLSFGTVGTGLTVVGRGANTDCLSNKWQHSSCCKKRKRKRRSIITWQIDILS